MDLEKVREYAGVGAFIVTPAEKFLTIQERFSSKRTLKEAGMRSHPMESTEAGESLKGTLKRLFQEEIKLPKGSNLLFAGPMCDVQINTGLWVRMFLFQTNQELAAVVGTATHEVENPSWLPLDEVLKIEVGSTHFRPGVRETALGYKKYKQRGAKTSVIEFAETQDGPLVLQRFREPYVQKAELYQHPVHLNSAGAY